MSYLFKAVFESGVILEQSPEDISYINKNKSCYFDVLEKQKTDKLLFFFLSDGERVFGVDLIGGRFLVNGVVVCFDKTYDNCKLIYFKERTAFIGLGGAADGGTTFCVGFESEAKKLLKINPDNSIVFL